MSDALSPKQQTELYSDTVKTVEADSSDINSQIISEWVWNSDNTHKLVVSCKKHDSTIINRFVDLDIDIDCGSIEKTLAVNTEETHYIQFNNIFLKPPIVVVSVGRLGYADKTMVVVQKNSVTASGCHVLTINTEGLNPNVTIYWIAIGKRS